MKLINKVLDYWDTFWNRNTVYLVQHNIREEGLLVDYFVYPFKTWKGAVKFIAKKVKKSPEDVEVYLEDSRDFCMNPQIKYKDNYYRIIEENLRWD